MARGSQSLTHPWWGLSGCSRRARPGAGIRRLGVGVGRSLAVHVAGSEWARDDQAWRLRENGRSTGQQRREFIFECVRYYYCYCQKARGPLLFGPLSDCEWGLTQPSKITLSLSLLFFLGPRVHYGKGCWWGCKIKGLGWVRVGRDRANRPRESYCARQDHNSTGFSSEGGVVGAVRQIVSGNHTGDIDAALNRLRSVDVWQVSVRRQHVFELVRMVRLIYRPDDMDAVWWPQNR